VNEAAHMRKRFPTLADKTRPFGGEGVLMAPTEEWIARCP